MLHEGYSLHANLNLAGALDAEPPPDAVPFLVVVAGLLSVHPAAAKAAMKQLRTDHLHIGFIFISGSPGFVSYRLKPSLNHASGILVS
jgi:hypothetical protein